jgi:hypothetical protein
MDYPLFSVKESLVPTAVVNVKIFEAETADGLEEIINKWVNDTQNLVVCPGPVTQRDSLSSVVITYVSSGENNDPNRQRKVVEAPVFAAKTSRATSSTESDGGRHA